MTSLLLPANAIQIIRGASRTVELAVTDDTGAPVDLTGAKVYLSVKSSPTDARPLIQKVSTDSTQVEITTPREGKAKIYFVPADTQNLDPHEYTFDVWAVLASGKRYPIIEPSIFAVQPGVSFIPL